MNNDNLLTANEIRKLNQKIDLLIEAIEKKQ